MVASIVIVCPYCHRLYYLSASFEKNCAARMKTDYFKFNARKSSFYLSTDKLNSEDWYFTWSLYSCTSVKGYKPWKWGVTARHYMFLSTKTVLVCYQQGSPGQDPASNRATQRPPDHCNETQNAVVWSCLLFSGLAKTILQGTVKGGRRQSRGRGGKTTGNGQAWSLASPRGQQKTGENGGNWLWNHLWCPNDPRG